MAAAGSNPREISFGGELWTDADGSAVVELAPHLRDRALTYRYQIRPLNTRTGTSIAAELVDGRLKIRSDAPHLKIEWRVTATPRTREQQEQKAP
jgi:hypothetical protein